jgi:hypothetical protein
MIDVEKDALIRRIRALEAQLWIARHMASLERGRRVQMEWEQRRREWRERERNDRRN